MEKETTDRTTGAWFERHVMRIEDLRLRRLTRKVWRRLALHERWMLRNLIVDFSDTDRSDVQRAGYLKITRARAIQSDAAAQYAIAYEFACEALRHAQLWGLIGLLAWLDPLLDSDATYTPRELDLLKLWQREHAAALCVWTWNFEKEMRAYYAEFPNEPRPRWNDEREEYRDENENTKNENEKTKSD